MQPFALLGRFADHLAAAPIGFDEFNRRAHRRGSDPVIGNVMNGAAGPSYVPANEHRNTRAVRPARGQQPAPRGLRSSTEPDKFPALDPVDDASVIFHEYGHGARRPHGAGRRSAGVR